MDVYSVPITPTTTTDSHNGMSATEKGKKNNLAIQK